MQILINILVVLDTLILGFGIYMVVTAKPVRSSREKNSTKGKDPVKAASEFEVTPIVKKRGRPLGSNDKVKKTVSSKTQKGRR